MATNATELHTYQCPICRTTATTTLRDRVRCPLCVRWMSHLFTAPIQTAREREWARQGVVLNPGTTTCDVCGKRPEGGPRNLIRLDGVGIFCSKDCADPEVQKHEAAMSRPPLQIIGRSA